MKSIIHLDMWFKGAKLSIRSLSHYKYKYFTPTEMAYGVPRTFFFHFSILTLSHMIWLSAAEVNLERAFARESSERWRQAVSNRVTYWVISTLILWEYWVISIVRHRVISILWILIKVRLMILPTIMYLNEILNLFTSAQSASKLKFC